MPKSLWERVTVFNTLVAPGALVRVEPKAGKSYNAYTETHATVRKNRVQVKLNTGQWVNISRVTVIS